MGFKRAVARDESGFESPAQAGAGHLTNLVGATEAQDSNQTLTAADILGGLYIRSGMTAARTDTTDTAVNLLAALSGMDIGDSFEFTVSVTVAFAWNIAAGAGVTLAGKTQVPASSHGHFILTKTGAATVTITGL